MNAPALDHVHASRRTALQLCAAPALLLVARLLAHPISNKPSDFVRDVQPTAGRTELGAALAVLGAALLVPTLVALAQHARQGRRRLSLAAGALTAFGCVGMVLVSTLQMVGARLSVQDQPVDQLSKMFDQVYNKGALPVVAQLAIVCGAVGGILLGMALRRTEGVSRAAAAASGLGTLLLFATAPGPAQPLLVAAAVIAGAGYAAVGVRVASPSSSSVVAAPRVAVS